MRPTRCALAVAITLSLTFAAQADDAKKAKAKKKKGEHAAGVVVEVKKDKDKDEGTIKIKVHKRAKKGATTPATTEEKVFKVTSATKFEKVSGKKGEQQVTAVTFAAIEKGEHVRVKAKDGTAEDVKIHVKKKGKNKAGAKKKQNAGS